MKREKILTSRRDLLVAALGAGGLGMTSHGVPSAWAQLSADSEQSTLDTDFPQVNWRLTSSFPRSLPTIFGVAEDVTKAVKLMSNGRFNIRIFAPQEIAPAQDALDVVSRGSVEMCHSASYYYVGKDDAFAFGSAIPFGMNTRQNLAWFYDGGGAQVLQKFYDLYNVHHLVCGASGAQMGGWFRKPVDTLADLKGLKMRISGFGGRILHELGAIPQSIAASDIYSSLESGTIDAAEWIGPADDEKLGFYKIARYYYYPGWWEGGPLLNLFINQQAWASLPRAYQVMLEMASMQATIRMLSRYDMSNAGALRRIAAQNVEIRSFSQDILKEASRVAFNIYRQTATTNTNFSMIWNSYETAMKELFLWHKFSESYYNNFVFYHADADS